MIHLTMTNMAYSFCRTCGLTDSEYMTGIWGKVTGVSLQKERVLGMNFRFRRCASHVWAVFGFQLPAYSF
jgi:hypothetical protein